MTQDFLSTPAKILITGVDGQIGYFLNQATQNDPFFSVVAFTDAKLDISRSEEHTSELQSHHDLVCRLLLEKKKNNRIRRSPTMFISTTQQNMRQ